MRLNFTAGLVVVSFLVLAGCGSGGVSTIPNAAPPNATPSILSVAVSPESGNVTVGASQQLQATAKYSDGTSKVVTASAAWSSSAPGIASVSASGLVTGKVAGSAKISATFDAVSGAANFSVNKPTPVLKSVTISPVSTALVVGTTQQLQATAAYSDGSSQAVTSSAKWNSSAPGIAGVSASGLVSAIAAGSATITATFDSMDGSAGFTVNNAVLVSLTINPNTPNVNLGGTLQLTALGTYQHNPTPQPVNGLTWSSSDGTVASVGTSGLVSGLKDGTVTITAKSGSISATAVITVVPVLRSLVVSPVGPAVVVGGVQKFSALGSYNDGTTADITSTAQWTSSDSALASISNGSQANGVAPGAVTIIATLGSVSGVTAMNVVSKAYPAPVGAYAFSLTSADSRGPAFFAGSLDFDGNGNITGVEDSNTAAGVQQNVAVTGTYVSYPDGRGNINITPNASHPSGISLRFLLAGGGTMGSLIEFDSRGAAKGSLALQNPAAFNAAALTGTYVFRASGTDSGANSTNTPQPLAAVGLFSADGAGNITSGTEDINDYGVVSPLASLSPSTYSVNSNGRGTFQLTQASNVTNYAFYIVDSTRINFIETNAAPASALAGVAELQTPQSYSSATLNGNYAFLLDRPFVVVETFADYEQVGTYSFDGNGNLLGLRNWESVTGTFAVSSNGRGTLSSSTSGTLGGSGSQDYRGYFFYLVSPSKMFLLQAYGLPSIIGENAQSGEADLQTGSPYSVSTLAGSYALESFDLATDATSLMLLNVDGLGGVQGIADIGTTSSIASFVLGHSQFTIQPQNSGFLQMVISLADSNITYDLFLVSNQKAWSGALNPPLDGSLDQQ